MTKPNKRKRMSRPKASNAVSIRMAKRRRMNKIRRDIGLEQKQYAENFQFDPVPFDPVAANGPTVDASNALIFDPLINLGTNVASRIGNKITMTSVKFSYAMAANSFSVSGIAAPCMVRIVFYYDRQEPTSLPSPYTNANFFDQGSGVSQFTGTYTDMVRKFNSDRYRICKVKTFKIGNANYGGTGASGASQFFSNNDFRLNVRGTVDLTKYVIRRQKFNDNLGTAQNRKLYGLVYVTPVNAASFSSTHRPVNMTYQTNYKFTDA